MGFITVKPKMIKGVAELSNTEIEYGVCFLVAGAIGNDITCLCKGFDYKTEYKRLFEIVDHLGGVLKFGEDWFKAECSANMQGGRIDCSGFEKILPLIAVLCAFCKGESRLFGMSFEQREILKGVAAELSHLGIKTELTSDGIVVYGNQTIRCDGTYVWKNPYLAMALVIATSRCEGELRIMGTNELAGDSFEKFMILYNKLTEDDEK